MAQRAALALAIACRPDVLVLDEPTGALDPPARRGLLDLLERLMRDEGIAIVHISHDLPALAHGCERLCVLHEGSMLEMGPTQELLRRPSHHRTSALIRATPRLTGPARAVVPAGEVVPASRGDGTEVMPLLQARGIAKRFPLGGPSGTPRRFVQAVEDVSFEVHQAETVGLIGASGSGKSTVGRLVLGLTKPDKGSLRARPKGSEMDVPRLSGRTLKRYRRWVQLVPQDPYDALNPGLTMASSIAEPLLAHRVGDSGERSRLVIAALAATGLTPPEDFLHRFPHQLSGGQRQRVCLARALVLSPRLLVLDEPGFMLDVTVRAGITALLRTIQEQTGVAYLYITHDLAAARQVCHRLVVIQNGRTIEAGPTEQVLERPQHPYTAALINATVDLPS